MSEAVIVKDLKKRYGETVAVDGVSFSIGQGEVFGLLGPNGAGKTTTVEMIEGLRKPDSGTITVRGFDALRQPARLREIIGVQLQSTTLYDYVKVGEILELFGTYYKKAVPVDTLLDEVSLQDKKNSYIKSLSGGQQQRVNMALALVNDPEVLFLDEPSTGLDPQARRNVWDSIEHLKKRGKTIMLTTHYMEEAETLCDRVGIMDHGRIIAIGSPPALIAETGLDARVDFSCPREQADGIISKLEGVTRSSGENGTYAVYTREPSRTLQDITRLAGEAGIPVTGLAMKQATLEDVFITLTGRNLRD